MVRIALDVADFSALSVNDETATGTIVRANCSFFGNYLFPEW
jgi:hypothetical protein